MLSSAKVGDGKGGIHNVSGYCTCSLYSRTNQSLIINEFVN